MKQLFFVITVGMLLLSCEKQLEEKPDKSLSTPQSLSSIQSMLDYYVYTGYDNGADEASADNYFVRDATYNGWLTDAQRGVYSWGTVNIFLNTYQSEWGRPYGNIYYSNVALQSLQDIPKTPDNVIEWNDIAGQALFKRGASFFRIANLFALPYDAATSDATMGIPLRLTPDFNERSVRASLTETYRQVISDLQASVPLLKVFVMHPARPSKPAAYGLLSRIYLSMRNYTAAKLYADSALAIRSQLMNYNSIPVSASTAYTFSNSNPESIYMSLVSNGQILITTARIDTVLYASYHADDLRKTRFFRLRPDGYYSFRGSYASSDGLYGGVATDELYITRAECLARAGEKDAALNDLNTLLVTRYKTGTYVPITATDAADALAKILVERRKELVYRFTRWMDIRRLNLEGAGITPKRYINGQFFELPPNSPKYARPIPGDVIALSGMPQNPQQ
ncbi:RagB/SusD family nutrient uptake outer membrane protein [Ferruginibacter sp. HRS2-29]|uniref:RagB/SusD family nutrient uptake outer membrane protein n=1 Tax=Ferruginibacter sp. HRS2-29 TaxID=2487334 RepID=UPI0020CEBD87|nr:RagB/SusD family nutrient uptake outer membrane protein [Ferruginibacter sp. HRS2-29]MCP9749661.1 RagB/SusD family nutrient uptake outer membrane protein [Ferruginibacter sp. HRS2-29]